MEYNITNQQARKFLFIKQGLLGDYQYNSKDDILKYIQSVGCLQYDPIDICGKNAELVLQARIKNFRKDMLYSQLYEDRNLIEYWDKNMSIYQITDWPYFARIRKKFQDHIRNKEVLEPMFLEIRNELLKKEYISSKDLDTTSKVDWYWSATSKARAALETMYFNGDIVIHHRFSTFRYFSLAEKIISSNILNSEDPNAFELDFLCWWVLRRIKGVGMLPNKPSYAFIYIQNLKATNRKEVFEKLLKENKIIQVNVENIRYPLYISNEDENILIDVLNNLEFKERVELLAPLDNLLWDRKLIKDIFNFDYTWEIYFPKEKRKYGYYVIPMIKGNDFLGRAEVVMNKKEKIMNVRNVWIEEGFKITKSLQSNIESCFKRFMKFNEAKEIIYEDNYLKRNI